MPAGQPSGEAPGRLRRWLAPRLLAWYAQHRRDLPWRADRDPYRIWVSEVMLQQTQVATVVSFFERFLTRFPTLADLARSDEQEVLRYWEGLGYYRRARDLRRASQHLLAHHGGRFPPDPDALRDLPGMGEYTRNAVLSQAFGLRLPILEANSQRVLSRLFGREEDPRQGPARRWLWQAAADLLPSQDVGDFNQALMELGALVCTPRVPRCAECPLAGRCAAFRSGRQEEIPARTPPPPSTRVRETAIVPRRGGEVLLVQRPETGRWANLWEFPHAELLDGEGHDGAIQRLLAGIGLAGEAGPELVTIEHGITRFHVTLVCFEVEVSSGDFRSQFYVRGEWAGPARLGEYPVSAPQRRLTKLLARPGAQRRLF